MHKHTQIFFSILSLVGFSSLAQEKVKDTVKQQATVLEEVVVTGQNEPQSIKKSVFNVRVISKEDIQRQAGNNLADVLNQYLNINVSPNSSAGRSTVSMFGLDGNYIKILVDNVPLVSDTGLGNNVDLTQINLDDIEQVEIIEGSMGVTHGANAVSGIINLITKKNSANKWEINATVQEETIGNEYEPFGKQGRHIQGLRAAHTINDNWFVSVGANRNDFKGFLDERGGRDYTPYAGIPEERQRGYNWLPKEQLFTNTMLRYQKGNLRIFYKFDFFNEDIEYYNPVVRDEFVEGMGTLKVSDDRRYNTNRFYHHLNAVGKLSYMNFNISASQQSQERNVDLFNYYIQTGQEGNLEEATYQKTEVLYSTGTLNNILNNKKADVLVGYEIVDTNGYTSAIDGNFDNENFDGKKRVANYDVFSAAELAVTDRFSIRPGFRYSFQSKFDDQWAASLGVRQLYANGHEVRASYGRSYRTPTYDELYTYLVDANHNVQGNPDLLPESSHSFEFSGKKRTYFNSGVQMVNALSATYLTVDNRIEQVIVEFNPLALKFLNINKYNSWNISTTHQVSYKNLQAKAGFTLAGVSREMEYGNVKSDDKFLYNIQMNASVAYRVPEWDTTFSVFYKLNGRNQMFVQGGTITVPEYVLATIDGFSLLDASIKKSFFNRKLDATLGARNILDVVNVRSSVALGAGTHTTGSNAQLVGYGRSYFAKLTYNLNF